MNNIAIIDDFELDLKNKRVINKVTGEIIDNKTDVIILLDQLKRKYSQDKAKTKKIKELFEIVEPKDKYKYNFNKEKHFIKIYRTELREYMKKVKLSPNAGLFLFAVQSYIEYLSNRIALPNKKRITNKELELITGLTERVIKYTLDELEEKKYIKRVGGTKNREIYINPYLICAGNKVEKQTLKYFNDYTPLTISHIYD